jgi:hydrogenase maturation protease
MNLAAVSQIAKAVLYEGYMLYPYRPSSVKNQQRWNFGVLCPPAYCEAQRGGEAWTIQTECLVDGSALTGLEVRVRFLQLVSRTVGELTTPAGDLGPGDGPGFRQPEFRLVEKLALGGRVYQPWQEAIEREVCLPVYNVEALGHKQVSDAFSFPAERQHEYLRDDTGKSVGVVVRERQPLRGTVEVMSEKIGDGIFKISVRVRNTTPFEVTKDSSRDDALLRSLASTHTVLGVQDGKFISVFSPPESLGHIASQCTNIGTWPVLVGEEGQCDTMLSSPIILYDYPQIAPESAGDLFDGTEIDEILSLRIMTLTDEEKLEMCQSDDRAREMLERTETMPVEQLMKLHGVLRGLRPVKEDTQ